MYRLEKDTNEVAWLFHFDLFSFPPPSYLSSVPVSSPPLSFYLSVPVSLSLILSLSISLPLSPSHLPHKPGGSGGLASAKEAHSFGAKVAVLDMWNRHLQVRIEVMNDWLSKLEGIVIENMDDWLSELDEIV